MVQRGLNTQDEISVIKEEVDWLPPPHVPNLLGGSLALLPFQCVHTKSTAGYMRTGRRAAEYVYRRMSQCAAEYARMFWRAAG